ncbi:MAG: site-2 protease family protein [Clostridia bacterium]|nr:site-2 protease family protein [Clostridia bacterium]
MGGVKFSVHPLFFALGFFYAITGRIFLFFVYTFSAVIHELGHSLVAYNLGYRLNKITLMPFGAVISGENIEVNYKDQVKIAVAGPITNLAIALLFIALWWVIPESYAFTESAVSANLALAIVNFIPIFPLDGGRVALVLFSKIFGEKKGLKICRIVGIVFSIVLLGLFFYSISFSPNYSLLCFSVFAFFGAINKDKGNAYVKLECVLAPNRLKHGVRVNKLAIDYNTKIKRLFYLLNANAVNEIDVYYNGKKIASLGHEKITSIIKQGNFNAEIGKFLAFQP